MRKWFPPAAVMVLAIVANSNVLANGFVYDDNQQILLNPWLRDPGSLPHVFSRNVWGFEGAASTSNFYRPAMHLLNMAVYQTWGPKAWVFHLVSLLMHALCTLLVWLVVREISGNPTVALWAELLFAVHPIHIEPVAWIAASPELAFSLLTLLALLCYIRGWRWWAAALFLPALLTKETAIVLPLLVAAWEWQQHRESNFPQRGRRVAVSLARFAPAGAIYLTLRFRALHSWVNTLSLEKLRLTPLERMFSAFYLVGKYLLKLVAPLPLNILPTFRAATSPLDWRFLAGLTATAAAVALAVALWRRKSPLWMAIVWILVPLLLPAAAVGYLGGSTFAERYLYLPSAGACWLVGALLGGLQQQPGRSRIVMLYGAVLVAVCAGVSWSNASIFHDDVSLWEQADTAEPGSHEIRYWLAQAYLFAGATDRALDLYTKAVADDPDSAANQLDYGITLGELGRLAEARAAFERAAALRPDSGMPSMNLGLLAEMVGDAAGAERYYRDAVRREPQLVPAHRSLGSLLLRENRLDEAETQFRAAEWLVGLGQVLAMKGHWHEAEDVWRTALRRDPTAETWYLLGNLLRNTGRPEEAAQCFREMRKLLPRSQWRPPQ
jgi:Flp pilus assembly protein TadD